MNNFIFFMADFLSNFILFLVSPTTMMQKGDDNWKFNPNIVVPTYSVDAKWPNDFNQIHFYDNTERVGIHLCNAQTYLHTYV
jgi:hypothetical protein